MTDRGDLLIPYRDWLRQELPDEERIALERADALRRRAFLAALVILTGLAGAALVWIEAWA